MNTTTDQIRALLAESTQRAESATKPPLVVSKEFYGQIKVKAESIYGGNVAQFELDPASGTALANAKFFAAARTDLPARDRMGLIALDALIEARDALFDFHASDAGTKVNDALAAMRTALQGEGGAR